MTLSVQVVAADRTVWSGDATMIIARTLSGEIGVLSGHIPLLSVLADSVVEIATTDGEVLFASVDGGFISVAQDRVSILSPVALLGQEVDVASVRADLEAAQAVIGQDDDAEQRIRRAEARIRAAERAS
jgi:F-type H+-transporting ATPase subunit epsilon